MRLLPEDWMEEILSKWQFKIQMENLSMPFESDTKIDDDILKKRTWNKQ